MTERESALREDLRTEYYALLDTVAGADGRLMIIKGWSVTLSLAGLGLGFQQGHYALFGLAGATAAAFWFLDGAVKGHQVRYYSRMRDIEVAAYQLNSIELTGLGKVSAPRIDMSWGFKGFKAGKDGPQAGRDWRTDPPERRSPARVRRLLRWRFLMPHVMFPHVVATALGVGLFLLAGADWGGLPTQP